MPVWSDVLVASAAVVGAAASANWLASGATRHARQLKAEADLWVAMPDSRGRQLLETWLDESSQRYVRHRLMRWPKRWLSLGLGLLLCGMAGAFGAAVCLIVIAWGGDAPPWAGWGVVVGLALFLTSVLVERKVGPIADSVFDNALQELNDRAAPPPSASDVPSSDE